MMRATERHRELIADLEAEAPGLREAQVMGIRRLASANQCRPARRQTGGDACRAAAASSASRHNLQIQALMLSPWQVGVTEPPTGLPQLSKAARNPMFGPSVGASETWRGSPKRSPTERA